jgi:hypothetical protein
MVNIAGWTGTVTFAVLALWSIVLAGVIASEHLAQTLSDGSATLCLARPVGRGTFAFARLAGSLAIALVTGAVLLGGTAIFLGARSGLPTGPALAAGLSCALGMVTVAALAMTASLFIPRIATVLLVFVAIGTTTMANVLAMFRDTTSGLLGAIDRFGPPLCSSIAVALSPWISDVAVPGSATEIATRHALWAAASIALLWTAFRRIELRD